MSDDLARIQERARQNRAQRAETLTPASAVRPTTRADTPTPTPTETRGSDKGMPVENGREPRANGSSAGRR